MEIVLSGIRAKKEQQGLTLHLNLEDARALGQILQNDPALQSKAESADASRQSKKKIKQRI